MFSSFSILASSRPTILEAISENLWACVDGEPTLFGNSRVYNCGGWVVDGPRTHPSCHLFAVDDEGQRFILDVSFANDLEGHSVRVGDETLLRLAARDAEHRIEAVNRAGLAFGRGWQYLRGRFG